MERNDSGFIRLPRSALTDGLWQDPNLARLFAYLLAKADESGVAAINSGEAYKVLGLARQTFRTLLKKLVANHLLTTTSTNKATTIQFDIQQVKAKRQPTKQPPNQPLTNRLSEYAPPSFVEPEYTEIWKRYMAFRKEIRKPYKSEMSEQIAYRKMVEMAGDDPEKARDMVERAIVGQWQGLYPKDDRNGTKTTATADSAASRKERRDRGLSLAAEIVAGSENLHRLYYGGGADPDAGDGEKPGV